MFDFATAQAEVPFPDWLVADLRTDHAGEVAAVEICRGALAAARSDEMRVDIRHHFRTERRHLALIEAVLDPMEHSRLLPLWRVCGRVLGFVSCFLGRRCYHRTVQAVEGFVDRHYALQIERLSGLREHQDLRRVLEICRSDEIRHRDEAVDAVGRPPGPAGRTWIAIVVVGSAAAVAVARRV